MSPENIERIAWGILDAHRNGVTRLTVKGGSICGQVAVDPGQPLSERQWAWIVKLAEKAGVPVENGEAGNV